MSLIKQNSQNPFAEMKSSTVVEAVVAPVTATTAAAGVPNYLTSLKVDGWTSDCRSIDNLLRHLSRKTGSEASRITYLRTVHKFCSHSTCDPDELLKLRKKKAEKLIQDFCDGLLHKNCSRRYISTVLHVLLTFFKVNGFGGVKTLNVEGYHVPARYRKRKEYIPSKNEIHGMADNAGSLKNRAIILTLYSTGLRVSTLVALTYGDVREDLDKRNSVIKIPVYAKMKERVPEACKGNIEYYTFVSEDATKAIGLYLAERMRQYGKIGDKDPLFASDCRRIEKVLRNQEFMTRREIEYIVKDAARRAGIKDCELVTPNCLRKAFESVLKSELIDGGRLDPKDQEYLMGHILPGSQDAYYDKSKVENLRLEYVRLDFGRKIVENKFKTFETALSKAFAETGVDWRQVLKDYVGSKLGNSC